MYLTFECLILCLHLSQPQDFGGVSQEVYKLQQTGQVIRVVSSHLWHEMIHCDSAGLYLIVLEVNTGNVRKVNNKM